MPGNILTVAATLQCAHAGTITASLPDPRVQILGASVLTAPGAGTVSGCTLPKNGPFDQTITWTAGSVRVTASGKALVLDTTVTPCLASGAPAMVVQVQRRVTAT